MKPAEIFEAGRLLKLLSFVERADQDPTHYLSNDLVLKSESKGSPEFRVNRSVAVVVFDAARTYATERLEELGVDMTPDPEPEPELKEKGVK